MNATEKKLMVLSLVFAATIILAALIAFRVQPVRATSGVAISAGTGHTCAVTASGGLKCWGRNNIGQLGNGTNENFSVEPVDVTGLSSGVTTVSAGQVHTCALTTSGGIKCWGDNSSGQLGDGTNTARTTPVDVIGLTSGISAVSASGRHTCAVTTAGGVLCWGSNVEGQLGDGTTTGRSAPVEVIGLPSRLTAISAGRSHTCAVTTSGIVYCWGSNSNGQLGDGTTVDQSSAVVVSSLTTGVAIISAGGWHTCAINESGVLSCWGLGGNGQLGLGSISARPHPTEVTGIADEIIDVSTGGSHTCAVIISGEIMCWGLNQFGELGNQSSSRSLIPVRVVGFTLVDPNQVARIPQTAVSMTLGHQHTCAITLVGGLKCWGRSDPSQRC